MSKAISLHVRAALSRELTDAASDEGRDASGRCEIEQETGRRNRPRGGEHHFGDKHRNKHNRNENWDHNAIAGLLAPAQPAREKSDRQRRHGAEDVGQAGKWQEDLQELTRRQRIDASGWNLTLGALV